MYPSSNNDAALFFGNYYDDNNHSKTPQEFYNAPSSNSFLPSPIYIPLEDEAVFCEFIQQQFVSNDHNHHHTINLEDEMPIMESTMEEYSNMLVDDDHCDFNTHVELEKSSPRKRHSKGDRHSKINTARGPRDRRMRLSLDVAKKLFGLQDLLGFDKASKTVDWLLTQSKTAILELLPDQSWSFMDVSNSASSTSECEVMSGTADQFMVMTGDDQIQETINNKAKSPGGISKKQKEKVTRVRKCVDFHHPLAKASRERARERARERTIEKRNSNQGVNPLGSWSTFTEDQRQSIDQMSSNFQFNQGFVCDNSSLLMTENWTPSNVFSYPHSSGLTHEHQLND